jgi:iron complex transport system substrate-binding protein
VVGVSGFAVRPKEVRQKPRVSTFLDARYDELLALAPDLVLGFSDLQADLARELGRRGVPVYLFNQRSLGEILQTVRVVAALVGEAAAGRALAAELEENLEAAANRAARLPGHPRVFFEEWPDPLISGIRWVSELIEVCGGQDVFAEHRASQAASGRIVEAAELAARDPQVIIASWCGKPVKVETIRRRPGCENVAAIRDDQIYEMASTVILQPGPAALSDGLAELSEILRAVAHGERLAAPRPHRARRAQPPSPRPQA